MSAKMIIIEGNSNDKDNVRAYMVKGEPGEDGISPSASISKTGDTATITVTDKEGTTTATVSDGVTPVANVSKANHVATITITDELGTTTATVTDGADLTDGAVPTGSVFDFDGLAADVPGGYEVITPNNITTGTEKATDEYIDNERVYRKRISLGEFPNNTNKTVTHGITNANFVRIQIMANNGSGTYQDMAHRPGFSSYTTTTAIVFNPAGDYSTWSGYADLYYTKS